MSPHASREPGHGRGARSPRRRGVRAVALATALVLAVAMVLAASTAVALKRGTPNPKTPPAKSLVFPADSRPYGMSYAEWSAEWWEFTLRVPNFDPVAEGHAPNCRPSDDPRVWFLVGIFNPDASRAIECVLPAGAALFLPVLNVGCSSVEAPPFFAPTAETQRACATALFANTTDIRAAIDGRPIADPLAFRVVSPQFAIAPLPADNRLGVTAGLSGTGVADGVYLMVRPLRRGVHTIDIAGRFTEPDFTLATRIRVVVGPKK